MRRNVRSHCLFGMIVLAVVVSASSSIKGQIGPPKPIPSPTPSLEKDFLKNILRDQKAIWSAPFHLERHDTKWVVPSTIGVMALFATDRITGDEIAEFDHLKTASRIMSYPGSVYRVAAVAASFYLIGRKTHNARARETGILIAESSIDSQLVVSALKGVSQRVRPQSGRERSEFFDGGNSFPSGHSAQAWTMATIIASEYHDKREIQIAAYSVATAVSIARFTGRSHYISDVLVGSALGFGIGKYVYRAHHRNSSNSDGGDRATSSWPLIRPQVDRHAHQYGIALTWNF